jgi:hypothetical protein
MTAAGARPIEQVAPQPKRPEPIRPAAAKPDVMTIPEKPTKQQPPPKSETPRPPAPVTQPPTTGPQVTRGNSRAETGAKGEGTGLALGVGGTGGQLELANFCCPAYLSEMVAAIKAHGWKEQQPVHGKVIMKFTIQRDGRIVDVTVEEGTEYLLNRASTIPLLGLQLKPLPAEFTEPADDSPDFHLPRGLTSTTHRISRTCRPPRDACRQSRGHRSSPFRSNRQRGVGDYHRCQRRQTRLVVPGSVAS